MKGEKSTIYEIREWQKSVLKDNPKQKKAIYRFYRIDGNDILLHQTHYEHQQKL